MHCCLQLGARGGVLERAFWTLGLPRGPLGALLGPRWPPDPSQTASGTDFGPILVGFSVIFNGFVVAFSVFFVTRNAARSTRNERHGGGDAEGKWIMI